MRFEVGAKIYARDASPELAEWCRENLVLDNPEYEKKQRMGFWTGNVPKQIYLYERHGNDLYIPFGCISSLLREFPGTKAYSLMGEGYHVKYYPDFDLYPYQKEAVRSALKKMNGVIVMPCGAGKTQTALAIIATLGLRALWLTHTQDLLNQSLNRAKSVLGCSNSSYGTITGGKVNIGNGITFATVQTMSKLDLAHYRDVWGCVIVDECMPGDTKIATPYGFKLLKNLCNGDIVTSYNRKMGKVESKKVIHTFKNKAHNIVNVNLSNGEKITCTGNHPIFTKQGWIEAEGLKSDDYVMRMVWKAGRDRQYAKHKQAQSVGERMVLLLKRMLCKGRSQEGCLDGRAQKKSIRTYEEDKCRVSFTDHGKNDEKQPYEKSRHKSEGVKAVKRNRASSKDKMWKRYGTYCTTANNVACTCRKGRGICRVSHTNKDGQGKWVSYLLQGRYCNPCGNDRSRGGRGFALCGKQTRTGQEERSVFEWIRVDSIEVRKQTSDGTFGGVCGDGYVYNIEVEDNNNYFANGYLVHNCHKAIGAPTKVMQFYKVLSNLNCRYKFGLTATPKRADGLERSMFALLGDVIHEVSRDEVSSTTCPVNVELVRTGYIPDMDLALAGDGTINYAGLVKDLTGNSERLYNVAVKINQVAEQGATLVLANRVEYLQRLEGILTKAGRTCICLSAMGQSKAAKAARKEALRKLNDGEIDCVLATYQLAKEGLDVPQLRYVVFATPEKDETTVMQAAGRVGRKAEGKDHGTVIDFVDDFGMYNGWSKKRRNYYKKLGYNILT